MLVTRLKGKIHRAVVTQAELDYVGSITIDSALMDAAGIVEYERVQVVDVNNGQRIETYVIAGERNSGVVCLNGAAARCVSVHDLVIIMAYGMYDEKELSESTPKVVFVDKDNQIIKVSNYEKHGQLSDEII